MVYTLFVVELISAFVLAATLLYRYGDCYRNHIVVTISVLTAWYFSFVIMFVLPLDITNTAYSQCQNQTKIITTITTQFILGNETTSSTPSPGKECQEPWSNVPREVFLNLWRVVYWTSQCLTWLIMPMMQSYSKAGDFTVKGKLKSALVDNAIYYGSYLLICGILLIYIALQPGVTLDRLKIMGIASSASNTWGLFLLILLLGYALVEVPRNLWNNSKKNYTLTYSYFKIAKLSTDKFEAEETVDDILDSLSAINAAVGPGHPMHRHVEIILMKLPIQLKDRLGSRMPPDRSAAPSLKSLVNLHKKMIKALHVLQRTETQWRIMLERTFHLEDILSNLRSPDHRFIHTFQRPRSRLYRIVYSPSFEWYWECFLKPYFLKTMAFVTCVLSFAVVWSEVTFFSKKPVLSIFALIVDASKSSYNYAAIVTVSTFVIVYMFYCAYSTLLKIRFLNLYYLAPHHQTNEYSLIFSGMMVCRLTPAMCLNFLSLVHMDSHIIGKKIMETCYTQIIGHLDVLNIIAEGFNIYFPMLVVLLCVATYMSLGSRLLSMCGFQQFVGDDELTTDLVDEGREIVKREKRKRQRAEDSMSQRRNYNDRFSSYRSTREPQDGGAHTGLLNDVDSDYYVTTSPDCHIQTREDAIGYQRQATGYPINSLSLEDELENRFGESTQPTLTSEFNERTRDNITIPPIGLFDDV